MIFKQRRGWAALMFGLALTGLLGLYVTQGFAEKLAYDDSSRRLPIQALALGNVQTAAYTASSAAISNVVGGTTFTIVRVTCTTDCFLRQGASPTAVTSDSLLPANTVEYFKLNAGTDKMAFIRVTADGTATVTEMD